MAVDAGVNKQIHAAGRIYSGDNALESESIKSEL